MNLHSKSLPFYLFIIGFFLLMIAPYLLSHGMFMDGIMYATISNNLANNIGDMTDLFFTKTSLAHFREHPPLAFWIQSVFYRLFGDSFLIEKLYSALTYLITGLLIRKIWIQITGQKNTAWLPLLFWISIPIITQAARNNLLENTMMVFTTSALFFLIKDKSNQKLSSIIMAGLMIYLGFMTKGFVALFLWSFPFWALIVKPEIRFSDFLKQTLLLICFAVVPFIIMCLISPSTYSYFLDYFEVQVANSVLNVQTVDSRFWILEKLLKELITPTILVITVIVTSRFLKESSHKMAKKKIALLLLFLGLSGVIPIIISLKQSGFYSIPAFAILAISIALFVEHEVTLIFKKINQSHWGFNIFRAISVLMVMAGLFITISNYGKNGRDSEKLNDIHQIANIVGKNYDLEGNVLIPKDWTVLAYFYRYHKINIVPTTSPSKQYFLSLKQATDKPQFIKEVKFDLKYFRLYEQY